MKVSNVGRLSTLTLSRATWYRAVPNAHRRTPLGSGPAVSRFCSAFAQHRLIYLARTPLLALLEVQALVRSFHAPSPLTVAPRKYVVFAVSVAGIDVVDFGDPGQRSLVGSTAQEFTGDWRAYPARSPAGSAGTVRSNRRVSPTQELGAALSAVPSIAGLLAPSAYDAWQSNLVVFAANVATSDAHRTITAKPREAA